MSIASVEPLASRVEWRLFLFLARKRSALGLVSQRGGFHWIPSFHFALRIRIGLKKYLRTRNASAVRTFSVGVKPAFKIGIPVTCSENPSYRGISLCAFFEPIYFLQRIHAKNSPINRHKMKKLGNLTELPSISYRSSLGFSSFVFLLLLLAFCFSNCLLFTSSNA